MTASDPRRPSRARRPQGQPTRGKTARNRLRRVDQFLVRYDPALLRRRDGAYRRAFVVDLGYGAEPFTTLEMAARLRSLNPELPVLGVEIDQARVDAALSYADDLTAFRRGGFNLPMGFSPDGEGERVRAVRAFNVLRQYTEEAVAPAYAELARYVLDGGLLVEGTSDPWGRLWVANVARKVPGELRWSFEALVFSTNFRAGFDPALFQAVLPKNLIHRMTAGEPIFELMESWKLAARRTMAERVWGVRRWFVAAAEWMAAEGVSIDRRRRWLNQGYLIVRHPSGSIFP